MSKSNVKSMRSIPSYIAMIRSGSVRILVTNCPNFVKQGIGRYIMTMRWLTVRFSYKIFWWSINDYRSPPLFARYTSCNFGIFPKMKLPAKDRYFSSIGKIQKESQAVLNLFTEQEKKLGLVDSCARRLLRRRQQLPIIKVKFRIRIAPHTTNRTN